MTRRTQLQQATYTVTLAAGQKLHLDLRASSPARAPRGSSSAGSRRTGQAQTIAQAATAAAAAAHKAVIFAYDEGTEGMPTAAARTRPPGLRCRAIRTR